MPSNRSPHDGEPKFDMPQPRRRQRLALRLAGTLLGDRSTESEPHRDRDPEAVFRTFVRQIGGFIPNEQEKPGVDPDRFSHPGAQAEMRDLLRDETTGLSQERRPKSGNDFDDLNGLTTLESAVARTLDGQRQSAEKLNMRDKVVKGLVRSALNGTTIDGHTRERRG